MADKLSQDHKTQLFKFGMSEVNWWQDHLQEHTDWVVSVAFSPDSKHIASGSEDMAVWIWNVKTGNAVIGPIRCGGSVLSVTFSPDGKQIVSGLGDQTIHCVWDAKGQEVDCQRQPEGTQVG